MKGRGLFPSLFGSDLCGLQAQLFTQGHDKPEKLSLFSLWGNKDTGPKHHRLLLLFFFPHWLSFTDGLISLPGELARPKRSNGTSSDCNGLFALLSRSYSRQMCCLPVDGREGATCTPWKMQESALALMINVLQPLSRKDLVVMDVFGPLHWCYLSLNLVTGWFSYIMKVTFQSSKFRPVPALWISLQGYLRTASCSCSSFSFFFFSFYLFIPINSWIIHPLGRFCPGNLGAAVARENFCSRFCKRTRSRPQVSFEIHTEKS